MHVRAVHEVPRHLGQLLGLEIPKRAQLIRVLYSEIGRLLYRQCAPSIKRLHAQLEAILAREHVGWFGLIGSKTKRAQFESRMAARGIAPERIATMVCPIGLPGIVDKAPPVIAASVAAQLLILWQAQAVTEPQEN